MSKMGFTIVLRVLGITKEQDKSNSVDELSENTGLCAVKDSPAETQTVN